MGQRDSSGRDRAMDVIRTALGLKIGIDLLEDRAVLLRQLSALRRDVDELERWLETARWRAVR